MNREFVNKLIKGLWKILKNIKIVGKKKEMGTTGNTQATSQPKQVTIGASTQVVFTIKSFIGTIFTILGIFASFYFIVVVPKINDAQKFQEKLYERVETEMRDGFKEVNAGVRNNGSGIKDLSRRFDDLNELNQDLGNTSGSFSSTTENTTTESVVPDSLLHN
jgi:hypothetical protein